MQHFYRVYFSEVESTSKAALEGAPATLTCKVTGLSDAVEISWLPSNSGASVSGNLDTQTGTQISYLTIPSPQTDRTYTCVAKSVVHAHSPSSQTEQQLDTFSMYQP